MRKLFGYIVAILVILVGVFFLVPSEKDKQSQVGNNDTSTEDALQDNDMSGISMVLNDDAYGSFSYGGNVVWSVGPQVVWQVLANDMLDESTVQTDMLGDPVLDSTQLDDLFAQAGHLTNDDMQLAFADQFPQKGIPSLIYSLEDACDLAAYSSLEVQPRAPISFEEAVMLFGEEETKVQAIYAKYKEQKDMLRVYSFESEDRFLIGVQLEDETDELYLAKGYDMSSPDSVIEAIRTAPEPVAFEGKDNFAMPALIVDLVYDYTDLLGTRFSTDECDIATLQFMQQHLLFMIDHNGVEVSERLSVAMSFRPKGTEPEQATNFGLNQPFWLVMKQADNDDPYLMVGVRNTEVMQVVESEDGEE